MNELSVVLKQYDVGKLIRTKSLLQGQCNQNWLITTSTEKYVLRKIFKDRTEDELRFELAVLDYLRNKNFSYIIPSPVKTTDGTLFTKHDAAIYWIYPFVEGKTGVRLDDSSLRELAKCMAMLHDLTRNYKTTLKRDWPSPFEVDCYLSDLEGYLKNAAGSRKPEDLFITRNYSDIKKRFESIKNHPSRREYARLKTQLIHCDFNKENVLFKDKRLVGLIDFDNCRFDKRIRELALFMMMELKLLDKPEKLDCAKAKELIRYYNEFSRTPLTTRELQFLPIIMASDALDASLWRYYLLKTKGKNTSYLRVKQYYELACYFLENSERIVRELS